MAINGDIKENILAIFGGPTSQLDGKNVERLDHKLSAREVEEVRSSLRSIASDANVILSQFDEYVRTDSPYLLSSSKNIIEGIIERVSFLRAKLNEVVR
jgi:hypothetical protein